MLDYLTDTGAHRTTYGVSIPLLGFPRGDYSLVFEVRDVGPGEGDQQIDDLLDLLSYEAPTAETLRPQRLLLAFMAMSLALPVERKDQL